MLKELELNKCNLTYLIMEVKKKISIVTPCYNEEDNVRELYNQVKHQFDVLTNYTYEHIFIDLSLIHI